MKRVGQLCIEIIRGKKEGTINKKLRFFFQGRLDSMASYPKITKLMAMAGFWLVLVGVEATDDKTLKLIDKGCTLENIKRGIQILHECGIIIMGNVIIGANLEDTIDDIFITIKRTRDLDLDLPSFTLLTPFPSTDFYKELKQKNLLLSEDYSKYNWLNPVIKNEKLNSTALKFLLFLGFFYINYYGGGWMNKLKLFYRNSKSRGLRFTFHPIRFFRTSISYYKWRCIVHYNLRELDNKIHQIKFGNLEDMKELRTAILEKGN